MQVFVFSNSDHDLHPRYYGFSSGNLRDVSAVIVKIVGSLHPSWSAANTFRLDDRQWPVDRQCSARLPAAR